MKLFLKTPSNRLEEVEILNKTELKLTKNIKDFSNLNDVKSAFSSNIIIKYTPQNLRVFGYYTNITTTDFSSLINGLDSVITTDSGDFIMDGKIIIKQIEKYNENFLINLLFTSFDAGFYNNLDKKEFIIPSLPIPNDYTTKLAHNYKKIDTFREDGDAFIYGLVDNGYNFIKEDPVQGFSLNSGFFSHDILSCNENSLSSTKTWDVKAPLSYGYGALPSQLQPLIRYEWLFEQLHSGYGYTYEGNIFSNPEFTNLAIAPKYNIIDTEELDAIDDFSWTGTITGATTHQGVFLECDTATNDLFYGMSVPIPYTVQPGSLYEVNNSPFNDYEKMFGSENGYDMYNIKWKKNFTTSVTMKVTIDITHSGVDGGYIRIILADGIYTPNDPDDITDPGKVTMNPYSFHIVEDIYLEATSSGSYFASYEKEFVIDEVHYTAMMNSGYVVRAEVINQCGLYSGSIEYDFRVDFTEMKLNEVIECGNSYNLEDVANLDFSEQSFMKDFITKFNIIPQVNTQDKTITYYTFDEFYKYDTELDWTQKILRDKKLLIDYTMKDIKSIYHFNNESGADNEDMPEEYGNIDIESDHRNQSEYTIANDLDNMFYKYFYWFDIRGVYNQPSDKPAGFPLIMNEVTHIVNQDLRMGDNSVIDEDRAKWNEDSELSKCLIGYPKQVFGQESKINGYEVNGVVVYNSYNTIEIDIMREDYTGSVATGQTEYYYPYFLGPINKLESDQFNLDNDKIFNSLTYNDIDFGVTMYRYYERELNNLINPQSHTITAYIILTEAEYKDITMRETVIVDDNRYIIKNVSNFQINKPTKVILLSWENTRGWLEIYDEEKADISMMIQTNTIRTPEFNIDYRIKLLSGTTYLTFNNEYHEVGKTYKIKMYLGAVGGDVYLYDLFRDGYDGSPQRIRTTIPNGSFMWIEEEYIRTSSTTDDGIIPSSDSLNLITYNDSTELFVHRVILEEYN